MDEQKSIAQMMQEIANEMCDKYCKYPDTWDEDKEGVPLCDSEHCRNCPLGRLA